ncbi:NlpC/P60 family protein [Prosthecobacter fluviatilis]|uniref:NlpC/P60 family protein n=1 Tax=Prosthecobacter fluviatilis TaxID=445931 RepID=A0ABW0KX83_9BACT
MQTSLRLLLVVWLAVWTGTPLIAATTSGTKKKQATAGQSTAAKKSGTESDATPAKSTAAKTDAKDKDAAKAKADDDEAAATPTHALVSTLSIEDIRGFEQYPKQIQSLVQSCLALTHLELGYLYGSHEPSKGGMDCSGTIYHVLHFQGLKDVPRQSDEMCNWVDKKSQLHLTPTATSFDNEEFAALKPGDLLFWTSPTETTRKLPVTHVMVYLGKLKKTGKRIVFGSSDGRSYMGERRSGVSVFDFSLPQPGSTKHFYAYGPSPGLLPPEPKPIEPERPVIAAVTPAAVTKEMPVVKETAVVKEASPPKVVASVTPKTSAPKDSPVAATKEPAEPKEEVRKAVAVTTDTPLESTAKKTAVVESKADAPAKTSTTSKPKAATTKKRSTTVATSTTRRRTPGAPPKSAFEQRVDRAVSSVRRFFQQ